MTPNPTSRPTHQGDNAGKFLGAMLSGNSTVEEIDLSENMALKEPGAILLVQGLATNTALRKLDLMGVVGKPAIRSERFLQACIDMFQTNMTLKKVSVEKRGARSDSAFRPVAGRLLRAPAAPRLELQAERGPPDAGRLTLVA